MNFDKVQFKQKSNEDPVAIAATDLINKAFKDMHMLFGDDPQAIVSAAAYMLGATFNQYLNTNMGMVNFMREIAGDAVGDKLRKDNFEMFQHQLDSFKESLILIEKETA